MFCRLPLFLPYISFLLRFLFRSYTPVAEAMFLGFLAGGVAPVYFHKMTLQPQINFCLTNSCFCCSTFLSKSLLACSSFLLSAYRSLALFTWDRNGGKGCRFWGERVHSDTLSFSMLLFHSHQVHYLLTSQHFPSGLHEDLRKDVDSCY